MPEATMRAWRVLIFLVLVLATHVALYRAYSDQIVPAHRVTELDEAFRASNEPIDLLFVGGSHTMNGIHAQTLGPRTANIAVAGEHVIKTYYRLRHLLDTTDREVRTVVLPFDAQVFSSSRVSRFEPEHIWGQYVPFWELGLRRSEPVAYGRRWVKAHVVPYAGELLIWSQFFQQERAFQDERDPTRFDERPARSERRTGAEAATHHFEDGGDADSAAVWAYRSLVLDLKRRGIQVVLVSYPVMPDYRAIAEANGSQAGVRTVLGPMLARHGFPHVDLASAFDEHPEWFYDGDHVNARGREEVTNRVARSLVRERLLPKAYPLPEGEEASYDWRRLDRAVRELLRTHSLPGAAIVVRQHGEEVLSRTWGSYQADTPIMAGSASKWISTATLMTLVDEGTLELDTPVSHWVPAFQRPDKRAITLRQALAHQSGLMARHPVVNDYRITLGDAVEHIATLDLQDNPGAAFRYGALGYHAVARAAEIATGESWNDLFRSRMGEPLGLQHTRYGFLGVSDNPGIAGNLVTTAIDFTHFLQMVLDDGLWEGKRLLSEEAIREMERGQVGDLPRIGHIPLRHLKTTHDLYGLGVWRDTLDPRGNLLVSSAPGKFGFTPWIDRRHGITGAFALQATGSHPIDKIPDPGGLEYLVCDIVDLANRRPTVRPEINPRCRRR